MADFINTIILGQFEAALWMLNDCLEKCPEDQWDAPGNKIAHYTFWQVAYHTLCFADLYLSPGQTSFQLRSDLHPTGWAEFEGEFPSRRFSKAELLGYVQICLAKARDVIPAQTQESLEGPTGFERRTFTRGELYIYSLRHIQHHTGQLSAFLRRTNPEMIQSGGPRWGSTGWK